MKITPLEIRQHSFDKSFRGYDVESVDAFLLSLSQEWDKVIEEVRHTKGQLENAEREIARMKEIESSLFKTLKAAEDTQKEINDKAQAEAEQILIDAKVRAEEINAEARKKANMTTSDAENKAKFILDEAVNDLKGLERDFKAMERYKDYLVVELKRFANDALEKANRFEDKMAGNALNAASQNLPEIQEKTEEVPLIAPEPVIESKDIPEVEAISTIPEPVSTEETVVSPELPQHNNEVEVEFEPAAEYDDENEELPTVHAIVNEHEPVKEEPKAQDVKLNNAAESVKEVKMPKIKLKKFGKEDDGLPTVASVMEELNKHGGIGTVGGGSFFDNI
ncbi:cell division initiation protein [Pseudarcicella hirudinis]|uniref:Cell division initiation protein n=1 Tax=Pseudarcicella hirudinis TaxID=1079859 RepID=A0A1I5WCI2_9BACT|nr:DivIVA domain-containing protein [Pseudarcicella hirudinis]SFQ17337.1 cell division initiation protein [Pseudarcicella hirudinis]